MSETFGKRLRRFALSVDIVDDYIFRQTWELIQRYLTDQLEPTYWALLKENMVNDKPGLLAKECSEGHKPAFSLRTDEGKYKCLAAYSFSESKPLWLVSADKETLAQGKPIKDKWSNSANLPHIEGPVGNSIKTMALIPLRQRGHTIGLLDLQSSHYTELTSKIKTELQLIAETLTELLTLCETNKSQRDHTLEAIKLHRGALDNESWPPLTKPKIFFASSDRADNAVIGTIRSVLDEFNDQLDVYYWKDSSESGNINWEILKRIKESQFGLCYFSEPTENSDNGYKYQDNANVVFEAGMLQSLTNPAVTEHPTGWIPIREKEPLSLPPPFDFAQQRMIIVERLARDGKPNIEKLKGNLKDRINSLLR